MTSADLAVVESSLGVGVAADSAGAVTAPSLVGGRAAYESIGTALGGARARLEAAATAAAGGTTSDDASANNGAGDAAGEDASGGPLGAVAARLRVLERA